MNWAKSAIKSATTRSATRTGTGTLITNRAGIMNSLAVLTISHFEKEATMENMEYYTQRLQ